VHELADDWRFGGTLIDDVGAPTQRRKAFNIMLSMPRGTDPLTVQWAAREFAQVELADHKYVMVLHDHQANPHVHISVRAESKHGKRLNPRKADLHRWRETFAEKLRERGGDAEATRQATRGSSRNYEPLWRIKAAEEGRLRTSSAPSNAGARASATRGFALEAWMQIGAALAKSGDPANLRLAASIKEFVQGTEVMPAVSERRKPSREGPSLGLAGARSAPDAPRTIDRWGVVATRAERREGLYPAIDGWRGAFCHLVVQSKAAAESKREVEQFASVVHRVVRNFSGKLRGEVPRIRPWP
jgi:hypothetical protein